MVADLNKAFLPVLEHCLRFKVDLGLCLQRLIDSFNLLLLKQFAMMAATNDVQAAELAAKTKEQVSQTTKAREEERKYVQLKNNIEFLIEKKNQTIRELELRLENSYTRINDLSSMLKPDQQLFSEPEMHFKEEFLNRKAQLIDPAITEESEQTDSSEEAELNRIDYDQQFSKLIERHDAAYDDRTNNLNNMSKLVSMLQQKGSCEAAIQTDLVLSEKVEIDPS